jgi:hypothetical protein
MAIKRTTTTTIEEYDDTASYTGSPFSKDVVNPYQNGNGTGYHQSQNSTNDSSNKQVPIAETPYGKTHADFASDIVNNKKLMFIAIYFIVLLLLFTFQEENKFSIKDIVIWTLIIGTIFNMLLPIYDLLIWIKNKII